MNPPSLTASPPVQPPPSSPLFGFFAYHGVWAPGVRLFRRLGFRAKASIVMALLVLPLLALQLWQSWQAYQSSLAQQRAALQQQVQLAQGLIAQAHAQQGAGKLTRDQAQALARTSIGALRFGDGGHFWITDLAPRMVMHPLEPELDGQDLASTKDAGGQALYQVFADTVRQHQAGYVSFQGPAPASATVQQRLAYVAAFEPWGWVVGSAVSVDGIRAQALAPWRAQGALVLLTVLLGGYAFHCFYVVMMGGLRETERHLRAMADGDLTTSPRPWGHDEAARLMLSVCDMQASLRGMVATVRETSGAIVHTSGEVASDAIDLKNRSALSAAHLERSASAMAHISATVQTTAEHVQQAAGLARGNADVAMRGGQVMTQVVQTMEDINAASSRIGDIIGTIDGIAFQTNILALNAAVEAARAGEQGRGFAVVAAEVRSLAQRSAKAAREIKTLIGSNVDKVASGTEIVREAGTTIAEIVANADKVDRLLGEITDGAREQSGGVAQIGRTVAELDQATQRHAALVDRTASASHTLREQAHALAADVARFRLPDAR
ncbi:MAG: cache domain-containing protein [Rubrivivax sp.]|nr:cache domain-containing protein [Rubrivivax sp.]